MEVWRVVFLVAVAGITVSADSSLTFPEIARGAASRIVSGWEAREGQFPFQLSVRMVNPVGQVNSCGGSILHPDWGMTAAHCTATRVTMVIRAGVVNLTRPEILFETTEYYNHPLYNDNIPSVVQPNDIALLRFPAPLTFSLRVQPVRLQRSVDMFRNYQGDRLTASGFGITWTGGSAPENMNWVFLRGVSNAFCLQAFGGSSIVVNTTICASGYNVTSQSTCSGDSGGPLTVVDDDGKISMVGVASFVSGTGCHTDFPAGFIRPGPYHDWYEQVTGLSFDWEPQPETTTPTNATSPTPPPPTTSEPPLTTWNPPPNTTLTPPTNVTTPEPPLTTWTPPAVTTITPPSNATTPEPPLTTWIPDDRAAKKEDEEGFFGRFIHGFWRSV